ncbi:MAG: class I SAM-dependent RNA methyltransferase [Bradymonadaceae bacterium]|nr:class I SAM-dependent RNA methyltransferase [Lujinxingiaceae bacterium]
MTIVWTRQQVREAGEIEIRIEGYGYTGEGFVRLEDGWLSVPGALPGELVRVVVQPGQREGARRIFARVSAVLEPSAGRRDPLCSRAAVCRGCQLRHMTVNEELTFKANAVAEVVEKYGGIARADQPEVQIITPQPIGRGDAFRIRTTLTYRRADGAFELGLVSPGHGPLITMHDCPALTGPAQRLAGMVHKALEALDTLPWDEAMARGVADQLPELATAPGLALVRIAAPMHGHGFIELQLAACEEAEQFAAALENGPLKSLVEVLCARLPEQVGLAMVCGAHRRSLKAPARIILPIANRRLEVGYDDWFHANLPPAEVTYEALMGLLELGPRDRLLDLGCGIGTISLLASALVEAAVGVDINRHSIATAEINAAGNGCSNVRFVAGSWEAGLRRLLSASERFTTATINPMREPLGRRALAYLPSLGIRRLVYLGPSPVAAARDIADLRELGFELDYLAASNLHPATYHSMLVARLVNPNP